MYETPYVNVQNIAFSRRGKQIFDDLSLTIAAGKITAIMGPSGTGKTTLLRLIGGELSPEQGQITIQEHMVHQMSRRALYRLRQKMGMLFQSAALFTDLSVFENVAFPYRAHTQLSDSVIQDLVAIKLEAVGLRGAMMLMPGELSGGMARRVALARAMALDPELIMYDEPFAGQDPISKGVLLKLIKRLHQALKMTSIIVSHDVVECFQIADHVYILNNGAVVGSGAPEELLNSSEPSIEQFLHGYPDGVFPFHYQAVDMATQLQLNRPKAVTS